MSEKLRDQILSTSRGLLLSAIATGTQNSSNGRCIRWLGSISGSKHGLAVANGCGQRSAGAPSGTAPGNASTTLKATLQLNL